MLIAKFTTVSTSESDLLDSDERKLRALLADGSRESLEIEDAWPALHFTLSGEVPIPKEEAMKRGIQFPASKFEQIFMGGAATSMDTMGGPVRMFTFAEVQLNSEILGSVSDGDLTELYEPAALDDMNIPPAGWSDDTGRLGDLLLAFKEMKQFYRRAAEDRVGILLEFR